jgi:hypothetical protein
LLRLLLLAVGEILDGFGRVGVVRFFVGHGMALEQFRAWLPASARGRRCRGSVTYRVLRKRQLFLETPLPKHRRARDARTSTLVAFGTTSAST